MRTKAAERKNDALRYTITIEDARYQQGVDDVLAALTRNGHQVRYVPNGWRASGYRGINIAMETGTGERFEVQVHTPASLAMAEETRRLYEEERLASTSSTRKLELRRLQDAMFSRVPVPPGISLVDSWL